MANNLQLTLIGDFMILHAKFNRQLTLIVGGATEFILIGDLIEDLIDN